uniref:Ig-like domain-containing protein n=1 Tax=Ornithorhynchus anatinus TaxID=9258 RepID=A0A6I8PA71_ORNAN
MAPDHRLGLLLLLCPWPGSPEEPSVSIGSTVSESGVCDATLTCSLAGAGVTLGWTSSRATVPSEGPVLNVSRSLCDVRDLSYTCTARTPAGNASRTVPAERLCTGPATPGGPSTLVTVIGAVGSKVKLGLNVSEPRGRVVWVSARSVVTAEPPGAPPGATAAEGRAEGRLSVSPSDPGLEVSGLEPRDAGVYRAFSCPGPTALGGFLLKVYRRPGEPSVTVNPAASDRGHCTFTLTCSVAGGDDDVTFSWTPPGPGATLSPAGSVLAISRRPGDPPRDYTCTVTNPVGNNSRTVPADRLPCPGNRNPEVQRSPLPWIAVLVLVVFPLVLFLAWYIRKQHRHCSYLPSGTTWTTNAAETGENENTLCLMEHGEGQESGTVPAGPPPAPASGLGDPGAHPALPPAADPKPEGSARGPRQVPDSEDSSGTGVSSARTSEHSLNAEAGVSGDELAGPGRPAGSGPDAPADQVGLSRGDRSRAAPPGRTELIRWVVSVERSPCAEHRTERSGEDSPTINGHVPRPPRADGPEGETDANRNGSATETGRSAVGPGVDKGSESGRRRREREERKRGARSGKASRRRRAFGKASKRGEGRRLPVPRREGAPGGWRPGRRARVR